MRHIKNRYFGNFMYIILAAAVLVLLWIGGEQEPPSPSHPTVRYGYGGWGHSYINSSFPGQQSPTNKGVITNCLPSPSVSSPVFSLLSSLFHCGPALYLHGFGTEVLLFLVPEWYNFTILVLYLCYWSIFSLLPLLCTGDLYYVLYTVLLIS